MSGDSGGERGQNYWGIVVELLYEILSSEPGLTDEQKTTAITVINRYFLDQSVSRTKQSIKKLTKDRGRLTLKLFRLMDLLSKFAVDKDPSPIDSRSTTVDISHELTLVELFTERSRTGKSSWNKDRFINGTNALETAAGRLLRECYDIDQLASRTSDDLLKLTGRIFDGVPASIVVRIEDIASRRYTKRDLPTDVTGDEWFANGMFMVDRLFEDVCFTIFSKWLGIDGEFDLLGYHVPGEEKPDGVLGGSGPHNGDVLYDAKSSKQNIEMRDLESQVRGHLRKHKSLYTAPEYYLVVGPGFTRSSEAKARGMAARNELGLPGRKVVLMDASALLKIAWNWQPRVAGQGRKGLSPRGKTDKFRRLLQDNTHIGINDLPDDL